LTGDGRERVGCPLAQRDTVETSAHLEITG
jgi:hypothetical protein